MSENADRLMSFEKGCMTTELTLKYRDKTRLKRQIAICTLAAICSGCVDYANTPILLPIGHPPNPPAVVHTFCVGDANAMYNEAKSQYALRLQLTGYAEADAINEEEQAKSAAHRKYVSCVASQAIGQSMNDWSLRIRAFASS